MNSDIAAAIARLVEAGALPPAVALPPSPGEEGEK
jgi:hypothetical protein